MSAVVDIRLDALLRLNGAGRLARLIEELPAFVTQPLTDDQAVLLDQLLGAINQIVIRERDEAIALYGETQG